MLNILTRRAFARRSLVAAALLATSLVSTACNDSSGPDDEPEPAVTSMRLTFGNGQTLTLTGTGTQTLRIPVGATTVTAQFLRADGSVDPIAVTPTFRLQVTPPTGSITYAQNATNAFAGTLTATTATNTVIPVTFGLLHIAENHTDFGPLTINITVGN
ncbi:MAG TPA: hypothetical protein VE869_13875 [Gemmatimonas sp.]|nr:hypothetical protein [Gemmatimonas sp.]